MANKTPLWPGGPNIYENVQGDLADKLQSNVTTLQESVSEKTQTITSLNTKIETASGKITTLIGTLDETNDATLIASLNEIYSVLNPS